MATLPDTAPHARTKYEPVIGLEVHVQLADRDQDFLWLLHPLWRSAEYECLPGVPGLPGALPVLNQQSGGVRRAGRAWR